MKRRVAIAVGAVAIALVATACAPAGGSGAGAGGTLRIGIPGGSSATVIDPYTFSDPFGATMALGIGESLVNFDVNSKKYNELAESWDSNKDKTVWTAKLRQGVKFNNGKRFVADDVVATFDYIFNPDIASPFSFPLLPVITSVTAVDDETVKFTLTQPVGWFEELVAGLPIIPRGFDSSKPVFVSAYKVQSINPGVDVTLVRDKNYYGDKPIVNKVVFVALNDNDGRVNALLSGQVDVITSLPPARVPELRSNSQFKVLSLPSGSPNVLGVRTDEGITADPRVREAIRLGVNRKEVLDVVYAGEGRLGNDLIGIDDPAYDHSLVRKQDVAKAKKLITEAGVEGADLPITVVAGNPEEAFVQVVARNLREIGLNATVNAVDNGVLLESYGQWQAWSYPSAAQTVMSAGLNLASTGPDNDTHWNDPEWTAAWEKAYVASDKDRGQYTDAMQKAVFDRGGLTIPAFGNSLWAGSQKVKGWPKADPTNVQIFKNLAKFSIAG
ncbi:MAG TPA: ABC transporter substrate-binding protein [Pseudolysinimonas sp.]|nr:ABC transporter substrate-binding protein [Pseudolysinimonas sp.]